MLKVGVKMIAYDPVRVRSEETSFRVERIRVVEIHEVIPMEKKLSFMSGCIYIANRQQGGALWDLAVDHSIPAREAEEPTARVPEVLFPSFLSSY